MEEIILLPTIVLLECAVEAGLAAIGRSKGRVVPWSIALKTSPPRCVDERLNRIERFLLVVVTPLGVVIALAGLATAFFESFTLSAYLLIVGFVLISLRGLFVAGCFAFAALAGDPRDISPA